MGVVKDEKEKINIRNRKIRFMRKMLRALKWYIEHQKPIPKKIWDWLTMECKMK